MAQMPLVLIPAYLVPLFIMLHLAALFQARQQAPVGAVNHPQRSFGPVGAITSRP
jgi:hypothetical protein